MMEAIFPTWLRTAKVFIIPLSLSDQGFKYVLADKLWRLRYQFDRHHKTLTVDG
jgi:hypothetical protein